MRFFFFLLLISFNAFAQLDVGSGALGDCFDADFLNPAVNNVYECDNV
jgi:hypothetical protein